MRAMHGELTRLLDDPYLQPYSGVISRRKINRDRHRCRKVFDLQVINRGPVIGSHEPNEVVLL